MKIHSLGFIGGERITRIFLQGLSNKNALPRSIKIFEPNVETLNALQTVFPEVVAAESASDASTQEMVMIAIHPPVVREILPEIKGTISPKTIVVSLAPKITLDTLASVLPTKKLARMIPNATSYVNQGYNPLSFTPGFPSEVKQPLLNLLSQLGTTFEVEESKLEAYAIVSAMLPTYFWFQWREIEKLGEQMGLTSQENKDAIQQTLLAAIELYFSSGLNRKDVIDLIPVKPIGEHESQISEIYQNKLTSLFQKIKP